LMTSALPSRLRSRSVWPANLNTFPLSLNHAR
jgi:hypothetical protein